MKKELKRFILFVVAAFVVAIIISVWATVSTVRYRHDHIYNDYIIANDYSYVKMEHNKSKTFSPIEKLPDSIDEEDKDWPRRGRLESDRSKLATCYEYEYDGLTYLEIEIYDNKLFTDGNDSIFLYYVEDT